MTELHRIDTIRFPQGSELGDLRCTCGWKGYTTYYATHRREAGARHRTASDATLGTAATPFRIKRRVP